MAESMNDYDINPSDQDIGTTMDDTNTDLFDIMVNAADGAETAQTSDTLSFDDFAVRESSHSDNTDRPHFTRSSRGINTGGDAYLSGDEGEFGQPDTLPISFDEDFNEKPNELTLNHIETFLASLPENLRERAPQPHDFNDFLLNKPVAPKKPMSAYFLYVNDNRVRYKEAHPEAGIADITKGLSDEWREVDEATKATYEARVIANKATYEAALAQHKDILTVWERGVEFRRETLGLTVARVEEGEVDVLPLSRVKAIAGLDDELNIISKDALVLISKAAEGFLAHMGRTLAAHSTRTGKRTVHADAVALAIKTQSALSFLRGCDFIFDGKALGAGADDDVAMGDDIAAGEGEEGQVRKTKRSSARGAATLAADHGAILKAVQKGASANPFDFAPASDVFGSDDVFGTTKTKKRASKAKSSSSSVATAAPAKRKSASKKTKAKDTAAPAEDAGEVDAAQYLSDDEGEVAAVDVSADDMSATESKTKTKSKSKKETVSSSKKKGAEPVVTAVTAAQGKQTLLAMLAKQQALSERQQQDEDFATRIAEMEAFTEAPLSKTKAKSESKSRKKTKTKAGAGETEEDDVIIGADGRRIRVDSEGNEVEALGEISDSEWAAQEVGRKKRPASRTKAKTSPARGKGAAKSRAATEEVLVVSDDDEEAHEEVHTVDDDDEEEEEEERVSAKRARGSAWLNASAKPVEEEDSVAAYLSDDDEAQSKTKTKKDARKSRRIAESESDSDAESEEQAVSGDDYAIELSDEEVPRSKRKRNVRASFAAFMKK